MVRSIIMVAYESNDCAMITTILIYVIFQQNDYFNSQRLHNFYTDLKKLEENNDTLELKTPAAMKDKLPGAVIIDGLTDVNVSRT